MRLHPPHQFSPRTPAHLGWNRRRYRLTFWYQRVAYPTVGPGVNFATGARMDPLHRRMDRDAMAR